MARAIARGDVPEADRSALAATLQQLAGHCEHEAGVHLETIEALKEGLAVGSDCDNETLLRAISVLSMTQH